jgi:AcrR family transcriptional regulator
VSETAGQAQSGETNRGAKSRAVRQALVSAALDLFLAKGYEETTVDEIAERAGVGRRTFFRYFPSKDDVVFPDHDERLAMVGAFLDAADPAAHPITVVCEAARLVLRMYVEDPAFAVRRYQLTRSVAPLRDREIATVSRYQHEFSGYLRRRLASTSDGALRAEVAAAAVVAAHNHVLRHWLRQGATSDVELSIDQAFHFVQDALDPVAAGERADGGDVVVTISRRDVPLWRVVRQIQDALAGLPDGGEPTGADRPSGPGR